MSKNRVAPPPTRFGPGLGQSKQVAPSPRAVPPPPTRFARPLPLAPRAPTPCAPPAAQAKPASPAAPSRPALPRAQGRARAGALQMHHTVPFTNTMLDDAYIYVVVDLTKLKNGESATDDQNTHAVVYVGQTCAQIGPGDRLKQHLGSGKHPSWSTGTHEIVIREHLKQFTKLEVTASERYWYDHYLNKGSPLENDIVPITKSTFEWYANSNTFRGTAIGFPSNWKPKS